MTYADYQAAQLAAYGWLIAPLFWMLWEPRRILFALWLLFVVVFVSAAPELSYDCGEPQPCTFVYDTLSAVRVGMFCWLLFTFVMLIHDLLGYDDIITTEIRL